MREQERHQGEGGTRETGHGQRGDLRFGFFSAISKQFKIWKDENLSFILFFCTIVTTVDTRGTSSLSGERAEYEYGYGGRS